MGILWRKTIIVHGHPLTENYNRPWASSNGKIQSSMGILWRKTTIVYDPPSWFQFSNSSVPWCYHFLDRETLLQCEGRAANKQPRHYWKSHVLCNNRSAPVVPDGNLAHGCPEYHRQLVPPALRFTLTLCFFPIQKLNTAKTLGNKSER